MIHASSYFTSLCFFFFQAEDGIRDLTVTGVQTCALPISRSLDRVARAAEPVRGPVHGLAVRIASLDDLETGRIDPVERRAIIKPDRRQLEEVLAMARRHVEVALQLDLPVLGGNDGTRIFLRHAHGNPTRALMPRGGVARGDRK